VIGAASCPPARPRPPRRRSWGSSTVRRRSRTPLHAVARRSIWGRPPQPSAEAGRELEMSALAVNRGHRGHPPRPSTNRGRGRQGPSTAAMAVRPPRAPAPPTRPHPPGPTPRPAPRDPAPRGPARPHPARPRPTPRDPARPHRPTVAVKTEHRACGARAAQGLHAKYREFGGFKKCGEYAKSAERKYHTQSMESMEGLEGLKGMSGRRE
jgi:hypothetical protein